MAGFPNISRITSVSYSAGQTVSTKIDFLRLFSDKLINHVASINFRVATSLTPHASNDDKGEDLLKGLISRVRLIDREGETVFDLDGYQIRNSLIKGYLRRETLDDPADISAGGSATTRNIEFSIPFYNLPGLKDAEDALQPAARFNDGAAAVEITFASSSDINATVGTTTVKFDFTYLTLAQPKQGVDIRYRKYTDASPTDPSISVPGRCLFASIDYSDRDYSGITAINFDQHQIAESTDIDAFVAASNAVRKTSLANTLSVSSPDCVPLISPADDAGLVQGSLHPESGQLKPRLTNSNSNLTGVVVEVLSQTKNVERLRAHYRKFLGVEAAGVFGSKKGAKNSFQAAVMAEFGPRYLKRAG